MSLINEDSFPIEYLYRLASEIQAVVSADPVFVGDIYRTVFGYQELSTDTTHFGSYVLPLTSTRRQDYDMCQYILADSTRGFWK